MWVCVNVPNNMVQWLRSMRTYLCIVEADSNSIYIDGSFTGEDLKFCGVARHFLM